MSVAFISICDCQLFIYSSDKNDATLTPIDNLRIVKIFGPIIISDNYDIYYLCYDNKIEYMDEVSDRFKNALASVKYNAIQIISANNYGWLVQLDNSYYYYSDCLGTFYYICQTSNTNCLILGDYETITYIDSSSYNNKLILYLPLSGNKYECDTYVNSISNVSEDLSKNLSTNLSTYTLIYEKNNKCVSNEIQINKDYTHETINYYSVKTDTIFFDKKCHITNGHNTFRDIVMLDNNFKLHMSKPVRREPYLRVAYETTQLEYENYLFKDFRSCSSDINIIYLQTTDNTIIRFNCRNSEFKIVATNCTFCVGTNRTKKSQ